jgi:hypothetical protein
MEKPRDTGKLTPLSPQRDSGQLIIWRLTQPRPPESCRWERLDGRWISIMLGQTEEIGRVVVTDSAGRRELVDSYEGALELAKSWRQ